MTTELRKAVLGRVPKRHSECRVCRFLASQDEHVRAEWVELLAEPKEVIPPDAIAQEMTERIRATKPGADRIHYVSVVKHRSER